MVISTAKLPPYELLLAVEPTRRRVATEQPFCRRLAGHDLGELPKKLTGGRCAPLARRSSQSERRRKLTLRELEALARALLPVLLAFLHAGVARQKTVGTKRRPQLRIEARDGARQSHANRSGLSADAAAIGGHHDIYLITEVGKLQRLGGIMLPRMIREVGLDATAVDRELARACAQKNARDWLFAAA